MEAGHQQNEQMPSTVGGYSSIPPLHLLNCILLCPACDMPCGWLRTCLDSRGRVRRGEGRGDAKTLHPTRTPGPPHLASSCRSSRRPAACVQAPPSCTTHQLVRPRWPSLALSATCSSLGGRAVCCCPSVSAGSRTRGCPRHTSPPPMLTPTPPGSSGPWPSQRKRFPRLLNLATS